MEWLKTLTFDDDKTSATGGEVKLRPWQVEPYLAQFDPAVHEVYIMAVEQVGKSVLWRLPALYRAAHTPAPQLIFYESAEKAEDINRRTFDPFLRTMRESKDLLTRTSARKDGYDLSNGAVIDFGGAGADISSKPARYCVADEVDRWPRTPSWREQQLRNLRKRQRSFAEAKMVVVCSPKSDGLQPSLIGKLFNQSDANYWHLRCLGCGKLTFRSCDVQNLQWDKDNMGRPVAATLRLRCPVCGHAHIQHDAMEMARRGGYIAAHPENGTANRGFQIGALGCPEVPALSWLEVATAQSAAGRNSAAEFQIDFWNSWRGLPFKASVLNEAKELELVKREAPLPTEPWKMHLFAADTQDNGWYWVTRGWDAMGNSWNTGSGFCPTAADLLDTIRNSAVNAGIIDFQGHRSKEVGRYVAANPRLFAYRGDSRGSTTAAAAGMGVVGRWSQSATVARMINANARVFQGELLYMMYNAPVTGRGDWHVPAGKLSADKQYAAQMMSLTKGDKKGNVPYSEWHANEPNHLFDAEKMILVLREVIRFGQGKVRPADARRKARVERDR